MSKHIPGPCVIAAVLATVVPSVALGQESIHVKTAMPFLSTTAMPLLEQLARQSAAKTAEIARTQPQYAVIRREQDKAPETVVIKYGAGGLMASHYALYTNYRRAKTKVEVRGPCYSACTLVLAYVADICIAEGAFMAFHAVRSAETNARLDFETRLAYSKMPPAVQGWLDDRGGPDKLSLHSFWTLTDRELWAMGYPKCPVP